MVGGGALDAERLLLAADHELNGERVEEYADEARHDANTRCPMDWTSRADAQDRLARESRDDDRGIGAALLCAPRRCS